MPVLEIRKGLFESLKGTSELKNNLSYLMKTTTAVLADPSHKVNMHSQLNKLGDHSACWSFYQECCQPTENNFSLIFSYL